MVYYRVCAMNLTPLDHKSRHVNPLAYEIPFAQTDYYKNSFFPRTIRDWNALPAEAVEASSLKAFRNHAFINRF